MLYETMSLIAVAILWGGTNPFLKQSSNGIVEIKAGSKWKQFLLEIHYLLTNFKYMVPMILNQMGSVVYFLTLQNTELSLSVPVANSLTFVFTAVSGWVVGEKMPTKNVFLGAFLIILGTALCCYDKYMNQVTR